MLIDSHAHLNFPQFSGEIETVIQHAQDAGVKQIVNVGTNLEVSWQAIELAAQHDGIYATAGYHPHDVEKADAAGLKALAGLVSNGNVVAVGETGLDFYRDYAPNDIQEQVFRYHIRLAREVDLPLVIHSRGAEDRVMEILEAEGGGEVSGVLHCYGGSLEQAKRVIDLNFYLGFGGTVTFKKSSTLSVALATPPDRLLLETDCPYLAPVPYRGRRNEPAYVRAVAEFLAEAMGEPVNLLAARTTENAKTLFRLV